MDEDDEGRRFHRNNNNGSPAHQCFDSTTEEPHSGDYAREPSANTTASITSTVWNFIRNCCLCCFPCSKSSQDGEDEGEKIHPVLHALAIAFSRRPFIVLLITYIVAFSITWIGLSEYGLPAFDDPYLGFETRSTSISNRIITLRNLKSEINQLQVLENYPGEKLSGREWRRRRRRKRQTFSANIPVGFGGEEKEDDDDDGFSFHNRDLCPHSPLDDYSRIALELKNPFDIFEYETIMLICFFQKKMEDLSSYKVLCEKDAVHECCPSWSLPNFITAYSNKTDCAQLQEADVRPFVRDLLTCRNHYKNESFTENKIPGLGGRLPGGNCWKRDGGNGSCPRMCLHGGLIHSAYLDSLDNSFLTENKSLYTMIIPPVAKSSSTNDHPALEDLPDELRDIVLPKDDVILAGYDFGLCILLRRLAYPNRLVDIQLIFGRCPPDISNIFNTMVDFIYDNFRCRVQSLDQFWFGVGHLKLYAAVIKEKGCPLDGCFGFIDGTLHRTCRPVAHQKEVYSGHKRTHGLKYQSIVLPNGLIANLYGPEPGRRHDSFMLNRSKILEILDEKLGAEPLYLYGDSGYPLKKHLITPYAGTNITEDKRRFNESMSKVRIAVEWEFGKLFEQFAFLNYKYNQKIFLQPVAKYMFIGGKDNTFKLYLVSDLQYMITASVLIFVVVCLYTKSIFVSVISFGILTLSLGNAYFIYSAILKVPYFPFMNMLVTIIVMGIGTDGTLILGSQWHVLRLKHAPQRGDKLYWEIITADLLQETTAPLFITTCTTAAAFFASLTSSITTIRCFSIFAGTSTLMGFVLLYFSVPPALILSELVSDYLISLLPSSDTESKGKLLSKVSQLYERFHELRRASLLVFTKPYHYLKITIFENHRAKCWLTAFLVLVALLMWSTFVVFVSPKFELPNTEQFQLLSSDHPIEKFDRTIEPNFISDGIPEEELGDKMTVYYIWGLQDVDTGNTLDPMDDGSLQFDREFSLDKPENQKWMQKLCAKLKVQPFYDDIANTMVGAHYDSCFLETMITWMERDCEHIFFKNVSYAPCCKMSKFPYDPEIFSKCVGLASRDMHRTPSIYFRADVAGPKFFVLTESASKMKRNRGSGRNVHLNLTDNTTQSGPNIDDKLTANDPQNKAGQLATFTLRVKTNVTFSLAYEKMNKFYRELETFYAEHLESENAPVGLQNGFFISAHLDFYDLQTSLLQDTVQSVLLSAGLCFIFLWVFIGELRIALGAVLCIFAIVIVSSAVLISAFSWKLGVFESIAVTVAIGLSDFTAHNSIEFSKRHSVAGTTSPTFFAAVTTTIMGLTMLLCSNVLVYQQIGAFFTVLIIVSWTYSVFFLSPVLTFLDFVYAAIKLKRLPMPPSSIYARSEGVSSPAPSSRLNQRTSDIVSGDEATVYCNTMLTSGVRRKKGGLQRKNRAISEPAMQHARNSVHFGRAESTELVDSPRTMGRSTRTISGAGAQSQTNMMEQWKLLKKLGTETAV